MNNILEYADANGELWRVEAGSELRAVFGIHGAEVDIAATLREWHSLLIGQPDLWAVVRRRFGVRPEFGVSDPRDVRAFSREELAKENLCPVSEVAALEAAAVKCWEMRPRAPRLSMPPGPVAEEDAPPMDPDDAAQLLKQFGFAEVSDEAERRYIAERIIGMSEVLESDSQAAICRSMIIEEAMIFFVIDPPIKALRTRMGRAAEVNPDADQTKDNKILMDMLASRGQAVARLEKTMEALGISEKQTNSMRKKGSFQDSVSVLIEGVRAYRAKADNDLLDGVFRGAEIEVLLRRFDVRDAQYRPDLALTVPHAVAGLFDPEYRGPKSSRLTMRKLLAGFREGIRVASGNAGETIAELDREGADEEVLEQAEENAGGGQMPAGFGTLESPED